MEKDFLIIEKIKKEINIDKLKSLFIHILNQHESELVEIQENNQNQISIIQQQLSDSLAMNNSFRIQIEKIKEIHENESDLFRNNEKILIERSKTAESEKKIFESQYENLKIEFNEYKEKVGETILNQISSIKKEKIQLEEENLKLKAKNKYIISQIIIMKDQIQIFKNISQNQKKTISNFVNNSKKMNQILKKITEKSCNLSLTNNNKLKILFNGLLILKNKIHCLNIKKINLPLNNFNNLRQKAKKHFLLSIKNILNIQTNNKNNIFNNFQENIIELLKEIKTKTFSFKTIIIGLNSSFRLFIQHFKTIFEILKKASFKSISIGAINVENIKSKLNKKLKEKQTELTQTKNEISILQKEQEITRDKLSKISISPEKSIKKKKKSNLLISSILDIQKNQDNKVNIGTLAHISTPYIDQMKERSKRISKEAELSHIQGELNRKNEKIIQLESQISGLRKIVKRNGSSIEEEGGKYRQIIIDLEEEIRKEKINFKNKNNSYLKLKKEYEIMFIQAQKVEPLLLTLTKIFKLLSEKVYPLIIKKNIPEELTELNDLSQEFFKVPITKIYSNTLNKNFIKKQEQKFINALQNNINVEEIINSIIPLVEELNIKSN